MHAQKHPDANQSGTVMLYLLLCILWSPWPFSALVCNQWEHVALLNCRPKPLHQGQGRGSSSAKLVYWVCSQSHVHILLSPSHHLHQWGNPMGRNIIHSATRVFQKGTHRVHSNLLAGSLLFRPFSQSRKFILAKKLRSAASPWIKITHKMYGQSPKVIQKQMKYP